jgi:transposase
MNLHLAEIAETVAPGAHAVLLVDQAGWHMSTRLVVPANITIIALPPKCPELNPVENVWQFLRDNWLSNRVFKSYDDLVDHCCEAWNKLVDQPWRIMSIGLRQTRASTQRIWPFISSCPNFERHPRCCDVARGTGGQEASSILAQGALNEQ